ncbi:Ada metal-binding domain-containing protein [Kitasatospora sp. NPDC092948]|uniref:Ada metal-binding domain-containing protein n=1 Tax=Kitasatospora sp. NPDC092948 TaxID=3364088 RepID=UPI00382DEF52
MTTNGMSTPATTTPAPPRTYTLIGPDGHPCTSTTPGTLGGYRPKRIYGRLDCPSALRFIAADHYVRHRVFFRDEATAIAAGYRPCGTCLPEKFRQWNTRATSAP